MARAEEVENSRALGNKVTVAIREIGSRPAGKAARGRPVISVHSGGGRPSGHPGAARLRIHGRQHPDVAGNSRRLDRRGRSGRRRPHHVGMVPARRSRSGPEAHSADSRRCCWRAEEPSPKRMPPEKKPHAQGSELALVGDHGHLGHDFRHGEGGARRVSPCFSSRFGSRWRQRRWLSCTGDRFGEQAFGRGAAAGCLLFVAYVFQTKGLELTTPSKSAFLTGLSIPMVPLAGSLVYRNRPRLFEAAGILIATLGMAMMTLPAGGFEIAPGRFFESAVRSRFRSAYCAGRTLLTPGRVRDARCGSGGRGGGAGRLGSGLPEPVRFHSSAAVAVAVLVTGLAGDSTGLYDNGMGAASTRRRLVRR